MIARVTEAVVGAATPIQQVTSAHLDQQLGSVVGLAVAAAITWFLLPTHGLNAMAVAVSVGLVIAAVLPLFQLHIIDKLHPFAAPFVSVAWRTMAVSLAGLVFAFAIQTLPLDAQRIGFTLLVLGAFPISWKLGAGLAMAGAAEWLATQFVDGANQILPHLISLSLLILLLLATLWAALRYALPEQDRMALGKKTLKRLRLV